MISSSWQRKVDRQDGRPVDESTAARLVSTDQNCDPSCYDYVTRDLSPSMKERLHQDQTRGGTVADR